MSKKWPKKFNEDQMVYGVLVSLLAVLAVAGVCVAVRLHFWGGVIGWLAGVFSVLWLGCCGSEVPSPKEESKTDEEGKEQA